MKYERFEDLPVWKEAAAMAAKMFTFAALPTFRSKGDLASQLQRATLSMSNNIAEGFERGTTKELISFLYIARGSAGETRSMLAVMRMMPEFDSEASQIEDFRNNAESIARQLRGWAQSLQDSDIKGQKYLTKETKAAAMTAKSRQAFLAQLDELMKKNKDFI